jgi:Tol biopolymer transport system component
MDVSPRGLDETFILSSEGGKKPKLLLPEEDGPYTDANWSPDGQKIVFSTLGGKIDRRVELRILDVASRKVTVVPGSERM